ncbi:STAS domain-containing protein [Actinomadura rupiterrae]|uniref:STAS domain-containing protein n=1 Tax=Actinomadura rupiterrae TaxID=559627 RepID=UPI0020A60EDF|nr:STAS domain-containing protein [Actinomadura rupiterrae]MCP2337391.1 anti-anti-sigma factor [Actinomadura rupiterrae]
MDGLRLAARRAGTTVTITVIGDLDMATNPELVAFLNSTLQAGDQHVSLGLAGVTFIDAGGLGVLVGFQNLARRQGADLDLVGCAECVKRLLRVARLDAYFVLN